MQRAAAGLRGQIVELDARRVDEEVALDRAEAGRKIRDASRCVFDVNTTGDAWTVERAFEDAINLRGACTGDRWNQAREQPKIQGAIQTHVKHAALGELRLSGNDEVRVRALKGG